MFERYTEGAKRVIFFARYEAAHMGAEYIETEHLLLGILRQDTTLAARYLGDPGPMVDTIRQGMEGRGGKRKSVSVSVDTPLSHQCKRVLAYAAEENERADHSHIGTADLLMGLLRDPKFEAARILNEYGVNLDDVRIKQGSEEKS